MADWYRDHDLSPDAYSEAEYLDWCQDKGLHVDAAGNVQYDGPTPVDAYRPPLSGGQVIDMDDEDVEFRRDPSPSGGLDTWEF
jgi:hypothetical protein